jgi:hypothetical protein
MTSNPVVAILLGAVIGVLFALGGGEGSGK